METPDITPETPESSEQAPVLVDAGPSASQGPPAMPYQPEPLTPSSERTWAMLAHLSIFLNLFTGFLGTVAALIIYLVFKDRSRYVAFQSMQSFVFQLVWFFGVGILAVIAWVVSLALSVVLVGLCLLPFAFIITLIPLAALVYSVIGAIQTSQGDDFRYWLVDGWVLSGRPSPGPAY